MLSRRVVHPLLGAWRPIAALMMALAILTPARGEEIQKDQPGSQPKKAAEKPNAPKSKADLEKTRAEVKQLEAQMDKLHEQMRDTARKLWKARAVLAEQGGKEGNVEHRFARRDWRTWARFHHAWRHGEGSRMHFARQHIRHMEEEAETSKLEQKVDQLQKTVEQLQRQLQGEEVGAT